MVESITLLIVFERQWVQAGRSLTLDEHHDQLETSSRFTMLAPRPLSTRAMLPIGNCDPRRRIAIEGNVWLEVVRVAPAFTVTSLNQLVAGDFPSPASYHLCR